MPEWLKNIEIGARILLDSFIYFFVSYLTILFSIFTIKVVGGLGFTTVLVKPEVILAFLATMPTYLIGIKYSTRIINKYLRSLLSFLIVSTIMLFGIVFNVKRINDMDTVIMITYTILAVSLFLTILLKVNFKEFFDDIETQKKADDSRKKKNKTLSNGKEIKF